MRRGSGEVEQGNELKRERGNEAGRFSCVVLNRHIDDIMTCHIIIGCII